MRNTRPALLLGLLCAVAALAAIGADTQVAPAPNGIRMPQDYRDWRVLSVSDRSDNHTMRAILGNDIAIAAARSGRMTPWPDGAALAKVAWKATAHPNWPTATVPGDFAQVEFMIKDSRKYPVTGGWGFARWRGMDLQPYGKDANFVQECFGCHMPVKDRDYVFTHPAVMR